MGLRQAGYLHFRQQVIFEYLVSNDDNIITTGTDNMIDLAQRKGIDSFRVEMHLGRDNQSANRMRIIDAAKWIKGPFRLYLRGHGNWQMMTLGNRTANEVAANFGSLANFEQCDVISITGCQLALSASAKGTGLSTNSFAKQFHRLISAGGTMDMVKNIPVFARTKTVVVTTPLMTATSLLLNRMDPDKPYKETGSKSNKDAKKVFYWEGNKQMMADATDGNVSSVLLGLAEFDDFGTAA